MKSLALALILVFSLPAAANSLYLCYNDIILQQPLTLDLRNEEHPRIGGPQKYCTASWIPTEETSKNYQDWQMLHPRSECTNWETGLFTEQRTIFELYLSPAILAGEKGFARLAFENLSEYGPKQTKTFLKCLPRSEF